MTAAKKYRTAELVCVAVLIVFIIVLIGAHIGGTQKTAAELGAPFSSVITPDFMTKESEQSALELFNLPPDKTEGVVFYANESVMDVSELLIVKLVDENDGAEFREAIEKRVEEQRTLYQKYAPKQYALLTNSIIAVSGNAVFYCTAENADELYEIFKHNL